MLLLSVKSGNTVCGASLQVIIHISSTKVKVKQTVCVQHMCVLLCFTMADIWFVVVFLALDLSGGLWAVCEVGKCLIYIKCELGSVFPECPWGWWESHSQSHTFSILIHKFLQLSAQLENISVNNKNKFKLQLRN